MDYLLLFTLLTGTMTFDVFLNYYNSPSNALFGAYSNATEPLFSIGSR
jgi:hypothetical protein